MREGMLWFDNSEQRDLGQKVARAAVYYRTKNGVAPDLCFVHPTMLLAGAKRYLVPLDEVWEQVMWADTVKGTPYESSAVIEVRATNSVLPNHFWVGEADQSVVNTTI